MRIILAIFAALFSTSCSGRKDMMGREITSAEKTALDTCNKRLQSGVAVRLEPVASKEAYFDHVNGGINVVWLFDSFGQRMGHVCQTSEDGQIFQGEDDGPMPGQPSSD